MAISSATRLALDGGTPVRQRPFPTTGDASGRDLGDAEIALLTEVIRSGRLNRNGGTKVLALERAWAELYGVPSATASTSGTAAIHVAVGALPLNPGDEVITTPITDWGTIGPILAQGCIPIFADLDPRTYCLDPEQVARKITPRTRAIIAVHLMGHPCDMAALLDLAKLHNLYLIEDCAQAHLASWQGRLVGTMGHLGAFSLQQSKQITTGDGGMTITTDPVLGEAAELFADKGWPRASRQKDVRVHRVFGLNYRMTELQGAVGLAQIGKAPRLVAHRRRIASLVTERIQGLSGVLPPQVAPGVEHSYWYYVLTIDQALAGVDAARFAKALTAEGIGCRPGYAAALHLQEMFQTKQVFGNSHYPFDYAGRSVDDVDYSAGTCPVAEQLADPARSRSILLPCNEGMSDQDAIDLATAICKVGEHYASHRA